MARSGQTYRYHFAGSILGTMPDEYALSIDEYYRIYSFYVTYSLCRSCSARKRKFIDYGWPSNKTTDPALSAALKTVLDLSKNPSFIFTEKNDLRARFTDNNLADGPLADLEYERAVIGITNESSNYHKLFKHVRNSLAHGKYKLRLSNTNEKMIVIQDDDSNNVTARIVLKLNTLLGYVDAVNLKEPLNKTFKSVRRGGKIGTGRKKEAERGKEK